jgi:uncharacterized membrane protein HdeD (DUF308 family)
MIFKNSWPLALCVVLDAMISVIYFAHAGNGFHASKDVVFLGRLTLAAGICTIAAALWNSRNGRSWLLLLNGLALGALGLILTGIFGSRISFRTIALLVILMAVSVGIFEMGSARILRRQRHVTEGWLLAAAGVVSLGFAVMFLALGLNWIKLDPGSPGQTLLWLGSYFGFSAICMLGLGPRRSATL